MALYGLVGCGRRIFQTTLLVVVDQLIHWSLMVDAIPVDSARPVGPKDGDDRRWQADEGAPRLPSRGAIEGHDAERKPLAVMIAMAVAIARVAAKVNSSNDGMKVESLWRGLVSPGPVGP